MNNNNNSNTNRLTDSNHIKIPHGLNIRIMAYKNSQKIVDKSYAMRQLLKIGLDVYDVYLTGKYVDPFDVSAIDPRLVSFVDAMPKEDRERLFYHMLSKQPPNELKRIRELAGIVD